MSKDNHGNKPDPGIGDDSGVGLPGPTLHGWTDTPRVADPGAVEALLESVIIAPDSRFEPVRLIATGGMAIVEEVRDRALGRHTVKKTLQEKHKHDLDHVKLFVREAQITSQLDHPAIVPVHALSLDHEGGLFFTQKFVEGSTLGDLLDVLPAGPIEYGELLNLLDVVVRVCDALGFAHDRGISHCDVKPANVLIGAFGQTYLVDWGIAHVRPGAEVPSLVEKPQLPVATSDGPAHLTFRGTPAYMAPEQASGDLDQLGPHTDIFGVGTILYEILARRAPYKGLSSLEAIARAAECRFDPPEAVVGPECVPEGLSRIAARAMARQPEARYAGIGELRDELVAFSRGGGAFPMETFAAGETIVREGELGDSAYFIRSGRCGVYRMIDGQRTFVSSLGPGEVFGETAVLSPGTRLASVEAIDEVVTQVVTGDVLTRQVESMNPWMGVVVRALAERFRQAVEGSDHPGEQALQDRED